MTILWFWLVQVRDSLMKEDANFFHNNKTKIINGFFLLLIIAGIVLVIVNNKDEFYKYKAIILDLNLFCIFIILAITIQASIFRSWRWYYLLIPIKADIKWRNVLRVTINALAANYSTPGKLGIPAKALLLKKTENIDVGKSLPSILGELFIEHSSEAGIALVCVLIGGHFSKLFRAAANIFNKSDVLQNILIGSGLVLLLLLTGFIFKRKLKSLNFINKLVEAINLTRQRFDCVFYSYLISVFNLVISYYAFWLLVDALGHGEVGFTFVVFAGTITNIIGLLSPLPGGIGVRELTIFGLYDFYFGIGSIAFLAILLMRLITYFALLLLFLAERLFTNFGFQKKLEVSEEDVEVQVNTN